MEARRLAALVPSGKGIFTVDALQIGVELWLVPKWLESPDGKWRTPALAIRATLLHHQHVPAMGADLVISHPIPRAVLDGDTASAGGIAYQVVRGPSDLFGPIPVETAQ